MQSRPELQGAPENFVIFGSLTLKGFISGSFHAIMDYGIVGTVGLGEKLRNFQVHPLNTTKKCYRKMRSMWQWLSKTFRFSTTGSGTPETDADGFEVNGSFEAASELKKSEHKVRSAAKITKFTLSKLDYSTKNPRTAIIQEPQNGLQH